MSPLRLDGVDLAVQAGEHVAVVGRSGSGESTLLNILGLLDTPTSGTYAVDGVDAASLSARRRGRMRGATFGFVVQQFHLLPRRWNASDSATGPTPCRSGSPVVGSSASPSRGPWCARRACCWRTSRPGPSTSTPGQR